MERRIFCLCCFFSRGLEEVCCFHGMVHSFGVCVAGGGVEDGGFGFICFFPHLLLSPPGRWQYEVWFPGGARMRESVSRSWNKVLRASLFFVVVCSGASVGSVSFLVHECRR
ncbi:hypothetical protein PVAP13_3KG484588 [Panicum virgatum]|uniref:Uncharacterized protein n=1 Tax=Panicum virgatum TaxID=38727 RepID=A0A8T0V443_PANVG|nr:hypothetical protein PVAP13_3KG484588 [Panicum virgatum]